MKKAGQENRPAPPLDPKSHSATLDQIFDFMIQEASKMSSEEKAKLRQEIIQQTGLHLKG